MIKKYFYSLLKKYLHLYIFKDDTVISVFPTNRKIVNSFQKFYVAEKCIDNTTCSAGRIQLKEIKEKSPDFVLLNGILHYERDIQALLHLIHGQCLGKTRLIITYYSSLWKPVILLASRFGLRGNLPESNWIAHEDVSNLLLLTDFEIVRSESKILIPFYIPVISDWINKYLAPLPFFRIFNLLNIAVARPIIGKSNSKYTPSVSVVVAARNEEGNINSIVGRLPSMGPDDELIFIEGGSTDATWDKILEVYNENKDFMSIQIAQQDGHGKGDAVRKGFAMAKKDILMILDADLTVPPEELPKFYKAIVSGKGEYINGSRLVYPMEERAMRFFNIIGNKFFATAFSFVLGQRFKDTLCGTKVISKKNYEKLSSHRSYFGDFDPFGDFDLIFGSSRMCLKIVEVPVRYHARTYGDTNISRWRHGVILVKMMLFAARKIKFI
ncbi:Undecaprenyl-phosphate 4-deoxy-4-formamido-L-arabinose transferase [Candidatus Electrothrix gigas]